jgi:CPA1 family monovalent cation:H+ antiporter
MLQSLLYNLVGQGLTLPTVTRWLVPPQPHDDQAEIDAREAAARAALEELDRAAEDDDMPQEALDYARRRYQLRLRHLGAEEDDHTLPAARALQRRLVECERRTIERLLAEERIDQATVRRLERELDLEEDRWVQLEESSLS